MLRLLQFCLCATLLAVAPAVHATTIASYTAGSTSNATDYYAQSFTVTGSGSFNSITFNFITSTGAAYANGTGYLFSSPYTASPNALSSTTTNLLGSTAAANGLYSFASSLNLQGGTQYFFYDDTVVQANTITGTGNSTYTGGGLYLANSANSNFSSISSQSSNFAVNGNPTAVAATPELSSLTLLATGISAATGLFKRLRR